MASGGHVYTGVWKNHDYDNAKGATLTLTTTNSAYLVAFLALFVGLVAGHFWAIICYTIFQIRSTVAPRSGMHHQQQVVLRNYHVPGSASWQLLKSMYFWRRVKGFRATLPALPTVLLALSNLALFGAAGIFSSRVTNKNSEVLVKGTSCGFWNNPSTSDANDPRSTVEARTAYFANLIEDFATASTMASMCSGNLSITSECISYAPERIHWETLTNISCPFASKMCVDNKAVQFDSGLVDSSTHLGINAPKNDRILFRRVVGCAPLLRDGYLKDWHSMGGAILGSPGQADGNVIPTQEGEEYIEFFYGPNYYVGLNSTFMQSNAAPSYNLWGGQIFTLQGVNAILGFPEASYFEPIPELNRTDADIDLLFLGQGEQMRYTAPVHDPWFLATTPRQHQVQAEFGALQNVTDYHSEYPMSAVGCTSQYQWCSPGTSNSPPTCTSLTGINAVFTEASTLFTNPRQKVILKRMSQVLGSIGDMSRLATALTGSVLLVNRFGNVELGPLPDTQWITELEHMYSTLMTVMQIRNWRYVGGYATQLDIQPAVTPAAENETWMCGSQMVRREDYQSFSVLGLGIIVGLGGLIIVVNLGLDSGVGWVQRRFGKREWAKLEWELLETEKLQRLAYQMGGVDMQENVCSVAPMLEGAKGVGGGGEGSVSEKVSTPESPQVVRTEFARTDEESGGVEQSPVLENADTREVIPEHHGRL
ncbi:hypothetical protein EJ04DRAFT_577289 [Polyplosphaeria fusca]|uniref:Uncharacterized protein n=1 Tax=Polyplosphaeria fusca TaxID=682080 RepID=A0A9P4QZE5_9PLEO|nr:hypothetical protein EJ04DRAFT_577289 [Polyplosphaeria fusca]